MISKHKSCIQNGRNANIKYAILRLLHIILKKYEFKNFQEVFCKLDFIQGGRQNARHSLELLFGEM